MSHIQSYELEDMDYGNDRFSRKKSANSAKTNRPTHGRRRGKSPTSVNGIHRRRRRKMSW